jgi:N-acetylmuramoyl-L-alanine amidase
MNKLWWPALAPVIILSAGHGSADPGAMWDDEFTEHDIVTQICQYTQGLMCAAGILGDGPVILVTPPFGLSGKIKLVNQWSTQLEANGFPHFAVEVHVNAATSGVPRGSEAFYFKGNSQGLKIAEILSASIATLGWPNRGVKTPRQAWRKSLGWVEKTRCTSVLLELGFLTNKPDREILTRPEGRHGVAMRLAKGLNLAGLISREYAEKAAKTETAKAEQIARVVGR